MPCFTARCLVFRLLVSDVQVALFSATMPTDVLEVSNKFMRDPKRILVKNDELTLEGIKQFFVVVDCEEWKFDTLQDLYETLTITQSIIYVNSRKKADYLANQMIKKDFTVSKMVSDTSGFCSISRPELTTSMIGAW